MRLLLFVFLLLTASRGVAQGKYDCDFFGEKNRLHTEKLLQDARGCRQAADIYFACRWGSSADLRFGSVVAEKCDPELKPILTPELKSRYDWQLKLCGDEYVRQQGTLYLSARESCSISVDLDFLGSGPLSRTPVQRASFDCAHAHSPLERSICGDPQLGEDDVILAKVYKAALAEYSTAERPIVVRSEREWLDRVRTKCSPDPSSRTALACTRDEFEKRIDGLDNCQADSEISCIAALNDELKRR